MITLHEILLNEGITYKLGDIVVGMTKLDNFKSIHSDEVEGHRELITANRSFTVKNSCCWRYNKITKEIFFWDDSDSMSAELKLHIKDYLKNLGYDVVGVKHIYDYKTDYEYKKVRYDSHGGMCSFYDPDKEAIAESITEAPVDTFQTIGDFDKGASFRDRRDREIIKNPVTLTKVKDFFKNTSVDFDFYFVNLPGRRKFAEKGLVSDEFVFADYPEGLGVTREQLKNGAINENTITVFFVGNSAGEKIPMTAWTMAHRFGHAIRREYGFVQLTNWLEESFEEVLRHYNIDKTKTSGGYDYRNYDRGGPTQLPNIHRLVKSNLFNQIGTMRSAREGKISRYFEFYYELFAQYLNSGKITLNKLKPAIRKKYGAYGREESAYTRNIEEVNDLIEGIERDFEYYAEDALGSCVGKIYIM
jgi:hypothetical protein